MSNETPSPATPGDSQPGQNHEPPAKPGATPPAKDAPPAAASKPSTPEEQMAAYEEDLKNSDWGHQPC